MAYSPVLLGSLLPVHWRRDQAPAIELLRKSLLVCYPKSYCWKFPGLLNFCTAPIGHHTIYCNSGYTPKSSDMFPSSWFLSSLTLTKLVQFFKLLGMEPVILFSFVSKCQAFLQGIYLEVGSQTILLELTPKSFKDVRLFSSLGIWAPSLFMLRLRWPRDLIFPIA